MLWTIVVVGLLVVLVVGNVWAINRSGKKTLMDGHFVGRMFLQTRGSGMEPETAESLADSMFECAAAKRVLGDGKRALEVEGMGLAVMAYCMGLDPSSHSLGFITKLHREMQPHFLQLGRTMKALKADADFGPETLPDIASRY